MRRPVRLALLSAVMLVLVSLRFVPAPNAGTETVAVQPIVRDRQASARPVPTRDTPGDASDDAPARDAATEPAGNAFASRKPPPAVAVIASSPKVVATQMPPPPVTVPTVVALPPGVVAPAPETAPFQVIGTYDDGSAPALFVATAAGAAFVRVGSPLGTDHRVTAITGRTLTLMQVSTRRTLELPIPAASDR